MPQPKKFGAFAGVFTPSILSILGVIMYLRLGWVVGEAGLINALAIIVIAHLISITTGLSISSIATDKKVKAGGIYYMLSRSLGLPMGGAIGILRYLSTSLSIGLFLIGFAENFLALDFIREFFHLGTTINDIRIVGTAAIIVLVVIAYISTSLAIKSQFVVFAAIALSLVAIVAGLFVNTEFKPVEVSLLPVENGMSFESIFAIFFPAVSGFTVGVAMSGDLKDPKKDIPRGSLMAILVGFVVYLSLAILFAFRVDRNLLLTNYNFLIDVSLWSPLVIAGVWAATLSSGLGGILGAPRILQALSTDGIMPRIFGKVFGVNNEPRNALILTFIIAELTILIGELNVVARIMSMFFLVAFGFINLSYFLESWASPDFRPSFRFPKWIAMTGFIISFAVMFKLDAMAMIVSIILTFLVYFILSKRNLKLEYGDVWRSVWSRVVRSSLNRIAAQDIEERNWQPNIILFSGRSEVRPYLIDFGKQLIGSQGLLSNFDLIQTDDEEKVLPRHKQILSMDSNQTIQGFFSRQHFCTNIYDGIKNISSIYGFSGIEPNTVMLGWPRQSDEPVKFIQTINYLKALDLNILLMDYDKKAGFGKYQQIDIWWRTNEDNGNLALILLKFLWLSNAWRYAKARILIVNPINDQKHIILQKTTNILENLRVKAEIKIINNQVQQRSFYDIVQVESVSSDLIFFGLPEVEQGKEQNFVDEINKLFEDIGTVIILKASTTFRSLNIGAGTLVTGRNIVSEKAVETDETVIVNLQETDIPDKPELSQQFRELFHHMKQIADHFENEILRKFFDYQDNLFNQISKSVARHFENLQRKTAETPPATEQPSYSKYNANLWFRIRRIISDYRDEIIQIKTSLLTEQMGEIHDFMEKLIAQSPQTIKISYTSEDTSIHTEDTIGRRLFKINRRLHRAISRNPVYHLHYRTLLREFLQNRLNLMLTILAEELDQQSENFLLINKTLINYLSDVLTSIEMKIHENQELADMFAAKTNEVTSHIEELTASNTLKQKALLHLLRSSPVTLTKQFADEFRVMSSNKSLKRKFRDNRNLKKMLQVLSAFPHKWNKKQQLLSDELLLELSLFSLLFKIKTIFTEASNETEQAFDEHIIRKQWKIRDQLRELLADPDRVFNPSMIVEVDHQLVMQTLFNHLVQNTFNRIKQASTLMPESIEILDTKTRNVLKTDDVKELSTETIYVSRLLDLMLQSEFVESVQQSLSEISEKLNQIKTTTNELIRSLDFRLNHEQHLTGNRTLTRTQKAQIYTEHITQLENIISQSDKLKNQVQMMFRERLATFEDKLTFFPFIQNAANIEGFIRKREMRRRWLLFQKVRAKSGSFVQHLLSQLWYRQSTGIIFTRRLKAQAETPKFRVDKVLEMVDQMSIKPAVESSLPYYYRQLFIRKQYYLNEFWTGRERELSEAESAVRRVLSGRKGAILVTGDHHSGKTFFSQYFIQKFYPDANTFILTPPYAGSTDVALFRQTLENVFDLRGSYYKIFHSLPERSVLIIDDLALWWEQSEQGSAVLTILMDLIDKYSHRCLFVVNQNRFSFDLMRRLYPIENYFLSIIELQPFSAEELQEIILKRNHATSFKLRLNGSLREHITAWDFARLFSRYFSVSGGNVGVALQLWLAGIEKAEENVLYLNTPQTPDISSLQALKTGWYMIIIQLMLHKRANLRKLARICRDNTLEVKEHIDILLRAGIIEEKTDGVYELSTILYPMLLRVLIEKEMI